MINSTPKIDLQFVFLLAILSGLYIFWTWNHEVAELAGDNAVYLLTAQFYSPWTSPSVVAEYFVNQSQFPPLYPLLLAIFGGGQSILTAHLITTGFLLLALVVMRTWLRINGINILAANLAVLFFALLPGTVKMAMFILSENLYLFLSLLALAFTVVSEKKESSKFLLMAAILVAAATLTRTVGISLAVAFCFYLGLKRPTNSVISGFLALAPIIFHAFIKMTVAAEHSYVNSLLSHYNNDILVKIAAQIKDESILLWHGWLAHFEAESASKIVGLFLVLSLMALVIRVYQHKLDGFYLLFYLIIILLWPFPYEVKRFIYPVLPIMVGQCLFLLNNITPFSFAKIKIRPVVLFIAVLLIISLPGTALTVQRFLVPLPAELEPYRRNEYLFGDNPKVAYEDLLNVKVLIEDIKTLEAKLPHDAIVYGFKPPIISLYSQRLALNFPKKIETDKVLQFSSNKQGPVFFYMTAFTSPTFPEPYYPLEEIEDQIEIMHVAKIDNDHGTAILTILARPKQ